MYEVAFAYLMCHYLPYHLQIVMETEDPSEDDCTVCLGPAILFCQQCSRTYCRECNTRRHCRLPDHQFIGLLRVAPLPRFGGETTLDVFVESMFKMGGHSQTQSPSQESKFLWPGNEAMFGHGCIAFLKLFGFLLLVF